MSRCHLLWGWDGWRPHQRWPWLWHCWEPGWGGWAWWPRPRGRSDCRAPTTGGWRVEVRTYWLVATLLCIVSEVELCVSPQSDAGLPDHLRAEVLGGQFECCLYEAQLLQEPIELCCAGQKKRAHLFQLEEDKEEKKVNRVVFTPLILKRWRRLTAATLSSQSLLSSDSTSRILVMASSTSRLE